MLKLEKLYKKMLEKLRNMHPLYIPWVCALDSPMKTKKKISTKQKNLMDTISVFLSFRDTFVSN